MGSGNTKLNKNDLRELKSLTHFKKHEITQWYKDFMAECPGGILKKEEFFRIYNHFFPMGDSTKFASYIFDVFDFNKAGYVTFREFIIALSITSRGSLDEKLDWAFRLYDLDGDGYISKEEMITIVDSIYAMVGRTVDLPADENTPEKRVNKIFKQMDLDKDGMLSIDEFREGSKCDPWIVQAMSVHLSDLN